VGAVGVNPEVGLLIEGEPSAIELFETFGVAEERAVVQAAAAPAKLLEGTIEPEGEGAVVANALGVRGLGKRAATKSDNHGFGAPALESFVEQVAFDLAEKGLALLVENLLDGAALAALDFFIHVEKAPAQALAEQPAHGGLAATHEPSRKTWRRMREWVPASSPENDYQLQAT
jgi:hypothetical protein